ncbi:hypothetical protein GCM10028824_39200 [Hymenobacter segetis]|uniref:DUF2029 domain-containing protein n=1 Tax=Hymenobacter segetis TaxID=2025509 RepID=A0ABU9M0M1_9BACT
MDNYSLRQRATFAVLFYVLLLLLVPKAGFPGDVDFWVRWASYTFEHGLGNVYQVPDNNYNPLFHYFLWFFGWLMGSVAKIEHYRHWIKVLVLVFDFAGAFWAASLVPERGRRFGLALLLLFNIGYLYNTLIWEQVDAIYTCLVFGAVVWAVQQRTVRSMVCYLLALAAKTQAIIFLPPLLLLWGPLWAHRPWQLVRGSAAVAVVALLILTPFIWFSWENYVPRILDINLNATQTYPFVSVNAYNFWFLLAPEAAGGMVVDTMPLAGLTYHNWGLLLFGTASALALLPLLVMVLAQVRARRARYAALPTLNMAVVLLGCGLIPLAFAFFNTQMHERYWHAAMLFLAAYGFLRRDYWLLGLVSVAYFLNLEACLRFLELQNYQVLIFKPQFVAGLFGVALALGLFKLYRLMAWRTEWQHIWPGAASVPVVAGGSYGADN